MCLIFMLEAGEDANNDPPVATPALFSSMIRNETVNTCSSQAQAFMIEIHHPRGERIGGAKAPWVVPSVDGKQHVAKAGKEAILCEGRQRCMLRQEKGRI